MSGQQIGGRYVLERRIAGGGMGTIWLALDAQLQRRVALKLMDTHRVPSPSARQRFAQEAKAVARLQHPHVVQIHDYGVDGDVPFIVMELLEGEDLEALLGRRERLPLNTVALLLSQVTRALGAAHGAGIVHRDLKPANLFLARIDGEEVVKVLDFGVAQLDAGIGVSEGIVGTPRYMSPEQLRGEPDVDLRSDLWSLAVVLYRALTGAFPFSGEVLSTRFRQAGTEKPLPASSLVPELGGEVDAFFARALALEPGERFASARELCAAFSALGRAGQQAHTTRILVVDDEPDMEMLIRMSFRRQVREGTFEFLFARDGEEALEKLRQNPGTDVVVSDLHMPRMDGLTFLSHVGAVNPLAKVIIVSAYGDMRNIRTAMNRGAHDFLTKPVDFQDLEATLLKTARQVSQSRQLVRSAEENDVLRMFVHGGIVERVLTAVRTVDGVSGERVDATVAFLDVEDFTPLTRQAPAESAIQRLNSNFEVIVPELASRGGVVDKFVGDAVMVVFRGQGHLGRALDACLAVRQQLQVLAFRGGKQSAYSHGVCIGLASGQVIAASIGARTIGRMDYTVLGDVVNTAAWLASHAERNQILVDGALRARVDSSFEFKARGTRSLSGGAGTAVVHELVDRLSRDMAALSLGDSTPSVSPPRADPETPALAAREG
ncbi:protein kinase [Corallococcus exercitus]|uniref:Protein kinase n=1 Tax=Corallococcus exercitus TaxID=2316736 RepID=A0A7Y4KJI9_9BACT|nr:protein kinase [Corallococcus exercitus]NOK34963.1 protein kinase [Corallococcus exercitus]